MGPGSAAHHHSASKTRVNALVVQRCVRGTDGIGTVMRFAAIADIHGNYLALEAVLADIRTQGIEEIVNLGDMASGPLDARRTLDALMALDAVHVLGNHDRYLIDRPPEKMGSWDRPAHAQRVQASRLAACAAADTGIPRSGLSLSRDTRA